MKKNSSIEELSVFDSPRQSPGFLLWHLSTSWRSQIEATLKPLDLTHPQFVVLAALSWLTKNGDRVTQAEVGSMAGLDPNTNSQVLRGLEQKGFLKRVSSSDRRAKNPVVTAKGASVLSKALPTVEREDALFFHGLTNREMESLIHLFQKLNQ